MQLFYARSQSEAGNSWPGEDLDNARSYTSTARCQLQMHYQAIIINPDYS